VFAIPGTQMEQKNGEACPTNPGISITLCQFWKTSTWLEPIMCPSFVFSTRVPFKIGIYFLRFVNRRQDTSYQCTLSFQNLAENVDGQGDLLQNSFEIPPGQQDEDPKAP
jgi:hypothetical protein